MENEKKEILHFLPRWDNGGMEHAVLDMVTHFSEKYNYEICAAFLESEYAFDEMKQKGIKFHALYRNREYSFKECVKGLYSYLKTGEYAIIHCHINNSIGLIFAIVAKLAGVPHVVVHTHNNSFGAGKLWLKKILRVISICLFGNMPDLYLACSDEAGRWTFGAASAKKANYHVVYNGINQDKFRYNSEKRIEFRDKYSLNEKFIIGHIGHFNYQKNQIFLIRTIREVSQKIPNVHYFFIGTGETKKPFLEEINNNKLNEFVTVIDAIPNPQDYYSMFDVFAFPSHFEGFGIVMIEAQMSGLQVVCSKNVPKETAISQNVEYLSVDSDESVQRWTDAFVKCNRKAAKIDRTEIARCEKYDIRKISEKIEGHYNNMMEKK